MNALPKNQIDLVRRDAVIVKIDEKSKERVLRDAVMEYQRDFFHGTNEREGYIDFMTKQGGFLKNYTNEITKGINYYTEKNRGDEKRGKKVVADAYVRLQEICLDLAVLRLNEEIAEKDIDEWSDRLVVHMGDMAGKITPVDYKHPAVKEAYTRFLKERAGFWKEFINKNKRKSLGKEKRSIENLIRETYTKEEFDKKLDEYETARFGLYIAFGKSLENFRSDIPGHALIVQRLGPATALKYGKKSNEYNRKETERIYRTRQ